MLWLIGVGWASPARAVDAAVHAALDQAPADHGVILVAPSLTVLGDMFATISGVLELDRGDLAAVLSEVTRTTGVTVGLNQEGPAMLILMIPPPAAAGSAADASKIEPLLILPTSDYRVLVENLGGVVVKDGDSATQITLRTGHGAYARRSGNFTVIGASEQIVAQHHAGRAARRIIARLGSVGVDCLERSQLAAIGYGKDLPHAVKTFVAMAQDQAWASVISDADGVDGDDNATIWHRLGGDILRRVAVVLSDQSPLIRDAEALIAGLDVTASGFGLTVAVRLRNDSPMAGVFVESGGAPGLLARLPDQPYLIAAAVSGRAVRFDKLGAAQADKMGLPVTSNWFAKTVFDVGKSGIAVGGFAQVYDLPAGALTQLSATSIVETGDTDGFVKALRSNMAEPESEDRGATSHRNSYSPNYLARGGPRVDRYVWGGSASGKSDTPWLDLLFGGAGLSGDRTGYLVESDSHVVMSDTVDTRRLDVAMTAVKSNDGLGVEGAIVVSRATLFDDPAVELYVNAAGALTSQAGLNRLIALGYHGKPPAHAPPIAVGAIIRDRGIEARLFVPMSLLRFAMDVRGKILENRTKRGLQN